MKKVFAFGVKSLITLNQEIVDSLDKIIALGYQIMVGDDKGASDLIQMYLKSQKYENVIVYYSGLYPRWFHYSRSCHVPGSVAHRNLIMSSKADYGLAVWDGVDPEIAQTIKVTPKAKVICCKYRKAASRQESVYVHCDPRLSFISQELAKTLHQIMLQEIDILIKNDCAIDVLIQQYLRLCVYPRVVVYSEKAIQNNIIYGNVIRSKPVDMSMHDYLVANTDYRLGVWLESIPEYTPADFKRKNIIYESNEPCGFDVFTAPNSMTRSDITQPWIPIANN